MLPANAKNCERSCAGRRTRRLDDHRAAKAAPQCEQRLSPPQNRWRMRGDAGRWPIPLQEPFALEVQLYATAPARGYGPRQRPDQRMSRPTALPFLAGLELAIDPDPSR